MDNESGPLVRQGTVKSRILLFEKIKSFFEVAEPNKLQKPYQSLSDNENAGPLRTAYQGSLVDLPTQIPDFPVELPASESSNSNQTNTLDRAFSSIKNKYFGEEPIKNLEIYKELKFAMAKAAPQPYQEAFYALLSEQIRILGALRIGIHPIAELKQLEAQLKLRRPPQQRGTKKGLPDIKFRPTLQEIKSYPVVLISIIEKFLSLVESENYQNFLFTQMVERPALAFNRLPLGDAQNRFYCLPPEDQIKKPLLNLEGRMLTRSTLDEQFRKRLTQELKDLLLKGRNTLNMEFREIMRLVFYAFLLKMHEWQSTDERWTIHNPMQLLRPLGERWIRENTEMLTHYLMRKDSEHPKSIPIEYPMKVCYLVKTTNSSPQRVQKADDITRWIERILRCEVDPLGNLREMGTQLNNRKASKIFSSKENLISWLRHDPSISFTYKPKDHLENNPSSMFFTVNIADIQPLGYDYLDYLLESIPKHASMRTKSF